MSSDSVTTSTNFIRNIIIKDLETGKHDQIVTRFPPEPNGHLHIGHAKSICLNFGVAAEFGGRTNLRFDDTNPHKENIEFVESIKEDVRWLGYDWGDRLFYASDYFEKLYMFAIELIENGKAYVCSAVRSPSRGPAISSPATARPSTSPARISKTSCSLAKSTRIFARPTGSPGGRPPPRRRRRACARAARPARRRGMRP